MILYWRRYGKVGGCGILWGRSSVGRAPALQAGGHEFESHRLHSSDNTRRCTLKTSYRDKIIDYFFKYIKTSEKQTKSMNSMWIYTSSKSVIERLQTKRCNAIHRKRSSKKERRVDALALRAEERRDKLRKAAVRSKYPLIRRYLNGETRLEELQSSIRQSITYGREPGELKHLSSRRKRKKHRFPK